MKGQNDIINLALHQVTIGNYLNISYHNLKITGNNEKRNMLTINTGDEYYTIILNWNENTIELIYSDEFANLKQQTGIISDYSGLLNLAILLGLNSASKT